MPACPLISLSPSFNSYSNCKLVGIAARVADEFDSDDFHDELYFNKREHSADQRAEQGRNSHHRDPDDDDGDEDFEFAFATRDSQSSSQISADEIFQNGKIRPVNPVFNRDLLLGHVKFQNEKDNWNSDSSEAPKVRHPLRKLFNEERETTSSSEADDLDGVAAETYCVWRPKAESAEEDGQCRKSSSTGGNSKRWRFKDL
ncbi:hypothetical protein DH2020_012957 [Rehmannia glutinosa]|uniref:Uncharacterized protein n=1 Tax=Rehmannia glutinosa TaxID=99300 RepID=A0ABR0X216_REHGL